MRYVLLLAWLILPVFPVFPQDGDAPYLIPRKIFVGDKGRLVFPLGHDTDISAIGAVIQGADLPQSRDLIISRVEVEQRGASVRLLVDFQAFTPGRIPLPPIKIALNGVSHTFTGLEVTVSSILQVEQRGMVLSGPLEPLAAPGTAALIYGTVLGIILLVLVLTLGGFWGKIRVKDFAERWRRRRVIRAMERNIKRLQSALAGAEAGVGREGQILETLSGEFRTCLGILTGINCRAMVPREFLSLPALGGPLALSPAALSELFRRCDILRFSGAGIEPAVVRKLLDEFKEMTFLLALAEKERYRGGKEARR
ncbi:hypothetical protein AGMMS49942_01790 [Spirochaetia bacterium]|nr:hypothetical protein AGMMS49942_01790 [Spirochaetia bacterium]